MALLPATTSYWLLKILNTLEIELNDFFEGAQNNSVFPGFILVKKEDYQDVYKEEEAKGFTLETPHVRNRLVNDFLTVGLRHVLCTDIDKDGTLQGPNQQLYKELAAQFPTISWQASGGISCLDDITQLKPSLIGSGTDNATPSGVILGRSLLEGKFTVSEALNTWEVAKSV